MAERAVALAKPRRLEDRDRTKLSACSNAFSIARPWPSAGGERAGEGAAGAVRVAPCRTACLAQPGAFDRAGVGDDQPVDDPRHALRRWPALGQQVAADEPAPPLLSPPSQRLQLRECSASPPRRAASAARRPRSSRVGEHRAAGRDHHRIEHDRHRASCSQPVRHRMRRFGRADHADLHRVDADVARPPNRSARRTISAGTGITACTPSVFCAVIAVIAVIAWPPSMVTVLMSAWMPAPPPLSEPAMIRMRGNRHRGPLRSVEAGYFVEQMRRADRPRLEIAAAIGADSGERPVDAVGAEGAFERADARVRAVRRQIAAAALAIGPQFQHQAAFTAAQIVVDDLRDQRLVLAFGHHPDHRLGARLADHQPAACRRAAPRRRRSPP